MERPSTSSERTPLVQPTYMFESSLARRYQKRLRNFQCAICVTLIATLVIALLVTVSYNLSNPDYGLPTTPVPLPAEVTTVTPVQPAVRPNLTMTMVPSNLHPLLTLKWPLKDHPPAPWAGDPPTLAALSSAIAHGNSSLQSKHELEAKQTPLRIDSPAGRAQRAAATASKVKPMADMAYAVEQATRALVNGTKLESRVGGVGRGPATTGSFKEPPYCHSSTVCPATKYRSIDGTCNNPQRPLRWGVANTPFRRVLPPVYGDGISSPRTGKGGVQLPSARDVSVTVHRPSYAHDISFTVMLAVWGQFIDHDITATALSKGANSSALQCCSWSQPPHPECYPVQLAPEDPFYKQWNVTCMEFTRSAPASTCHFGPREQLNQATAFIDASTVYSPDAEKAAALRTGAGGRLRMLSVEGRDLLPRSTDLNDGCNTADMNAIGRYCFDSGDDRANENLHLTTMHLIWARQHNRVAAMLQTLNPGARDEQLYQETRRIIGAQMQHITYNEFLPNVLGVDVMWALNLTVQSEGYSEMYDPGVDPSVANHFAAAAFRFAHTLLPGLIHSVDASTGTVNYVHLHEMLFNPFQLYQANGSSQSLGSAINTNVHNVDLHVTDELSNHLFERPATITPPQGPCGLDLVSLNIQRGRDHGLPGYPAWRQHCGLSRPGNFDDLREVFDEQSFQRISAIYKDVDDIDLYTGALAEDPQGRLLGPTLTCMIADQFLRLKIGDSFWYERSGALGFSAEQLTELRKTTLAGVICANEELLESAQPRAMEELSAKNPLVACTQLPQPSFEHFVFSG